VRANELRGRSKLPERIAKFQRAKAGPDMQGKTAQILEERERPLLRANQKSIGKILKAESETKQCT
jgi:hypothetical protein